MIRNQFGLNNQQQGQIYLNQLANATTSTGAPPVDMSHLTAEERAMIQSVMAKAEMVNNNNTPQAGANLQTQMVGQSMGLPLQQNLQRQPNMQQIPLMGGPHQQLRQFDPMSGAGNSIRMQTNPASDNLQQQHQSLAFQPGGSQMNQQIDSSRSQLPALERRTQDLVNQINNQFNLNRDQLGSSNASGQLQRPMNPQPASVLTGATNQINQQQLNAVQSHGAPRAATISQQQQQQNLLASQNAPIQNQAQNFPQSNIFDQQQMFNANQQVAQGRISQMPLMFNPQIQQNFPINSQNGPSAQNPQQVNLAQTIPVGVLPSQMSFDGRLVTQLELQNQIVAQQQQQQQPLYNPQAYGISAYGLDLASGAQMQPVANERQNIKFRHDEHVFSDQENQARSGRANRRNNRSVELADENSEEDPEDARRWRHKPAPHRRPTKRPGQSRCNQMVVFEPQRGCSSDRTRQRQAVRQTSNLAPSSSESSLTDEKISSASSNSAVQTRSRPAERQQLPRRSKHENQTVSPGGSRTETSTSKTRKLMSELKLNEQASQVMVQQQLLIKQSQELIKLQQAQMEQQAKRPPPLPDENLSSPIPTAKSEARSTSRQVQAKCATDSSEIRAAAHETDSSIDSDQTDRQRARVREQRFQTKRGSKLTRDECPLAESPTNTTGSDSELLTRHSGGQSRQRTRRTTPTSRHVANRESSRASTSVAGGFTQSPLPVEAAIELHKLQALHNPETERGRGDGCGCGQQRAARSRVELLRSRSVCNSPQGSIMGRIICANSPDRAHLNELAQRLVQRKLLPDPPANAVPLTPSMVRKMVDTQRVAAASSSKLPTSVNAQSTLLTNYHSFRQPSLDQRLSSVAHSGCSLVGYQCDQLKHAPKSIGSYTARINGAQVSFAQDQSLASNAAARHQRLSALSRADLSKFLDFTNSSSILKSSPQRLQRASDGTGRPFDEHYRHLPGRSSGSERSIYEPMSHSERRLQAYRDERLSSRLIADRGRRYSEGNDTFGSLNNRSRFSTALKHVNFENNNFDHSPSLSTSMPNRFRSGHPSDLRLLSSPQHHEWSPRYPLENRPSRYKTPFSSIDNARFSTGRAEWSPRSSWAANLSTTSDRLLNRYNTSRVAYNDDEPTSYTSYNSMRNPNVRCPYRQRSFNNI